MYLFVVVKRNNAFLSLLFSLYPIMFFYDPTEIIRKNYNFHMKSISFVFASTPLFTYAQV